MASVVEPATNRQVAALAPTASRWPVTAGCRNGLAGLVSGVGRWKNARGLGDKRTRLVNQLHAVFRELLAGGAPTGLTATIASRLLTGVRPAGRVKGPASSSPVTWSPRSWCGPAVKALTAQIADTVAMRGSRLTEVAGVGPVVAGRLLARTRALADSRPRRHSPTAPASPRWRFPAPNESVIACPAAAVPGSTSPCTSPRSPRCGCLAPFRTGLLRHQDRGRQDHNEAMRCLKRRLAGSHVWPGHRSAVEQQAWEHQGATLQSSAAGSTPTTSSPEKSPNPPPPTTTGQTAA